VYTPYIGTESRGKENLDLEPTLGSTILINGIKTQQNLELGPGCPTELASQGQELAIEEMSIGTASNDADYFEPCNCNIETEVTP